MGKPNSDKGQPILKPEDFVKYLLGDKLAKFQDYNSALICFDPECYEYLKTSQNGKIVNSLTGEVALLERNIILGGLLGIGAPASVAFTEELIACGIKRFVFLGTAGKLHDKLKAGDRVICEGAFSDEGTSKSYPGWKEESFSIGNLQNELKTFLRISSKSVKTVKAWTTDAPYMETKSKLFYYLDKGADVVEMEASALCALAKYRKVEMAQMFIISDSLARGIWEPYFEQEILRNSLKEAGISLLQFLAMVDQKG